ncbi:MAG: phosphate ABC transporter permease subunit PstC [Lachnospiraceae bacterium]|nr:phosphate ABC transporter permease subunit PstC [Lachnospiraceae bacterium]
MNTEMIKVRAHARAIEIIAQTLFTVCALFAIFAVAAITLYMLANGIPAICEIGIKDILFSTIWQPTAQNAEFGILYIVLTSIVGTMMAVIIGVPIALLTAVFMAEIAPRKVAALMKPAVELLAGIPSVVYGMLGLMILNPVVYRWEQKLYRGSETHQFTGGSNLLSAVLVLAVMILPTVLSVSESAIREVPQELRASSLALGASRVQTIFKVVIPAAKPGILTAIVLGVGRAVGEAMAISLVSGGCVNVPLPFDSVRFLTTAIVSEMGYANGRHRQVLFTIGLVLFIFIMLVNLTLNHILRRGKE